MFLTLRACVRKYGGIQQRLPTTAQACKHSSGYRPRHKHANTLCKTLQIQKTNLGNQIICLQRFHVNPKSFNHNRHSSVHIFACEHEGAHSAKLYGFSLELFGVLYLARTLAKNTVAAKLLHSRLSAAFVDQVRQRQFHL